MFLIWPGIGSKGIAICWEDFAADKRYKKVLACGV